MSMNFDKIFQERKLTESECAQLSKAVIDCDDYQRLLSWVYILGYSCPPNENTVRKLDGLVKHPMPGLTAIAMRVLMDFWGMRQQYLEYLDYFLDPEKFEEWDEEVVFSFNFVDRNLHLEWPSGILEKHREIKADESFLSLIR